MPEISIEQFLAFVEAHRVWGSVLIGLLAFGESLAFIGLLLPATFILIGAGTLVATGVLPLWEVWVGGAVGGALGDLVSYLLGRWLGPRTAEVWPFRTHPHLLLNGEAAFRRWGWMIVFGGRFIGPLRATVPVAAGMFRMPLLEFNLVNVASAVVWIPVLVMPGVIGQRTLAHLCGGDPGTGTATRDGLLGLVCGSRSGGLIAMSAIAFALTGLAILVVFLLRRRFEATQRDAGPGPADERTGST